MIVRSAYLEGTVAEADRERFDRHMSETVMPAIATYPGIKDVRLRHIVEADAGAPPIHVIFDLYFDSLDAMNAALASDTRHEVRKTIAAVMPMFKGRVYHLVAREID
jgi:uncharacterized protein (TIGR02118 family)